MSMTEAVHVLIPLGANEQLEEYNKKNSTKIRRVYDVANVLSSLSMLHKMYMPRNAQTVKRETPRAEAKVLLWSSFSPLVIRKHFIRKHAT
jgi:hypothetical protein